MRVNFFLNKALTITTVASTLGKEPFGAVELSQGPDNSLSIFIMDKIAEARARELAIALLNAADNYAITANPPNLSVIAK